MTAKRALFRIRYRTRFIVAEPELDSHIGDLQIMESRWQNRHHEAKRMLARVARTSGNMKAHLAAIGQTAQIIDQFYTVEMSALCAAVAGGEPLASALHQRISTDCIALLEQARTRLLDDLTPRLAKAGASILRVADLDDEQKIWLQDYFQRQVFPLLIPQAIDASHPFPHLENAQLNMLVELSRPTLVGREDSSLFANVMMPASAPRLIEIPATDAAPRVWVWREEMSRHFVELLFPGVDVLSAHAFRTLHAETRANPGARVVTRLDVEEDMPAPILHWLTRHLHAFDAAIADTAVMRTRPPLGLVDLASIAAQIQLQPHWVLRQSTRLWDLFFGHI